MYIVNELVGLLERVSTVEEFYSVTRFFMEAGDDLVCPDIHDSYTTKLVLAWKRVGLRFGLSNPLDVLEEVINRMGVDDNEFVAWREEYPLSRRVDTLGFSRRIENTLIFEGRLYLWQIVGVSFRVKGVSGGASFGCGNWWFAFFAAELPHQQIITTEDDLKKYGVYLGLMGEGTYAKYLRLARRAVGKRAAPCIFVQHSRLAHCRRVSGASAWSKIQAGWEGGAEFPVFAVDFDKYFVNDLTTLRYESDGRRYNDSWRRRR